MQKFVFILLLSIARLNAYAQQEYFLYVQSDEHLPFYARVSSKIFSSSEGGYLIIPKLADSSYAITIGFARNLYPEQRFTVAINKADKGYQLKRAGEKWELVNLQTKAAITGTSLEAATSTDFSGTRKTDAFSQLLANVVNDSSILFTAATASAEPVKKKKAAAPGSEQVTIKQAAATGEPPVAPADSITSVATTGMETKNEPVAAPEKAPPKSVAATESNTTQQAQAAAGEAEKPFITKIAEETTPYQYTATYLEQYILKTDTIRISIIRTDTPVAVAEKQVPLPGEQQTVAAKSTVADTPTDTVGTAEKKPSVVMVNSDCTNLASEHDVDKLRIKLLAEEAIDDKLVTARKYFKTRCFTVKQIRALAELFPTDETRYRFFDTSYPFVSDTSNIYLLEDMIQNDYYKNRFKAMIHK